MGSCELTLYQTNQRNVLCVFSFFYHSEVTMGFWLKLKVQSYTHISFRTVRIDVSMWYRTLPKRQFGSLVLHRFDALTSPLPTWRVLFDLESDKFKGKSLIKIAKNKMNQWKKKKKTSKKKKGKEKKQNTNRQKGKKGRKGKNKEKKQ